MEVVLSYISTGLYVLGAVTAFFGILCLASLNAKPSAKNRAVLEKLTPEQIAQGKKNAKTAFIYIFVIGILIALIGHVLKTYVANVFGA
ncbi:MAG: hypothetical protein GX342_07155 [Alcaligenaceae bacterium]|jgi:hypothetical protein|nr:hypothetical protein [Alcaligenaceae bacterium]